MTARAQRIALIMALATCLGLVGCGRKGRLEPPPASGSEQGENNKEKSDPGIQRPKRQMFLDNILN